LASSVTSVGSRDAQAEAESDTALQVDHDATPTNPAAASLAEWDRLQFVASEIPQTAFTLGEAVGFPSPLLPSAAVALTASLKATGNFEPMVHYTNEPQAAITPASGLDPAHPTTASNAGLRLASYVMGPSSARSADALDLFSAGADAPMVDGAQEVTPLWDNLQNVLPDSFDGGRIIPLTGQDDAQFDLGGDWLRCSNASGLIDSGYAVAEAINPDAAVAMMAAILGIVRADRGDRSQERQARTRRQVQV